MSINEPVIGDGDYLMFKITSGKGFHITFKNGWTASVQFGAGNYCDNYHMKISCEGDEKAGAQGSRDAECAVFYSDIHGLFAHPMFEGDTVGGYMSPEKVLELLNWAASQPPIDKAS